MFFTASFMPRPLIPNSVNVPQTDLPVKPIQLTSWADLRFPSMLFCLCCQLSNINPISNWILHTLWIFLYLVKKKPTWERIHALQITMRKSFYIGLGLTCALVTWIYPPIIPCHSCAMLVLCVIALISNQTLSCHPTVLTGLNIALVSSGELLFLQCSPTSKNVIISGNCSCS